MRAIALLVGLVLATAPSARAKQQPPTPPPDEETRQVKQDSEMADKIAGKWTMEINQKSLSGTVVHNYNKDKTFEGIARLTAAGNQKYEIAVSGKWEVKGGTLECTVEKSSPNGPLKGEKIADKVVAVGDKEMKLRNKKGEDQVFKR